MIVIHVHLMEYFGMVEELSDKYGLMVSLWDKCF